MTFTYSYLSAIIDSHCIVYTAKVKYFMLSLILDTSSEKSFIFLCQEERILDSIVLQGGPSLSNHLIEEIDCLVKNKEIPLNSLNFIGLGVGPGSYTGLRVSASIVKTISYVHNIPIVEFGSLEAYSPEDNGPFVVMLDAHMGGVYFILGEKRNGETFYETASIGNPTVTDRKIITPNRLPIQKKYPESHVLETNPSIEQVVKICVKKYLAKDFVFHKDTKLLYLA
jgi:tRNA threonylcarbamoyl adenosine modification protein YeaZ